MDAVEILLFCLVGLSVSVFLVLDNLEKGKRRAHHVAEEKSLVSSSSSVKEDYFPEDVKRVRDHEEAETQVTCCNGSTVIVQEIEEENEAEKLKDSDGEISSSEKSGLLSYNDGGGEEEKEEQEWFDDDDCEGVERSELEKLFGKAVVFVGCKENADQIRDEQRLELYGLQKVAFEGACRGSQPMIMALNVSARSKWNSWQKLGDMSRETAMERYVDVLSEAVPGWKMRS